MVYLVHEPSTFNTVLYPPHMPLTPNSPPVNGQTFVHGVRPGSAQRGDLGPSSPGLTNCMRGQRGRVQRVLGGSRTQRPLSDPQLQRLALRMWNVFLMGKDPELVRKVEEKTKFKRILTLVRAYDPNISSAYPPFLVFLEGVLESAPSGDSLILLGNFNAHVDGNSQTCRAVVRKNRSGGPWSESESHRQLDILGEGCHQTKKGVLLGLLRLQTRSKRFWTTIWHLRKGQQSTVNTVYSGDSVLLISTKDVVDRWREYFKDLLNPTDPSSGEEAGPEDKLCYLRGWRCRWKKLLGGRTLGGGRDLPGVP